MSNRYTVEDTEREYYYQMPKHLVHDDEYKDLSSQAIFLYSILKDKHRLSLKNNWVDQDNHVYFYCTRENMADILRVSRKTATKIFNELITRKLLEEEIQGENKPNKLYLIKYNFSLHSWTGKFYPTKEWTCKNYPRERTKDLSTKTLSTKDLKDLKDFKVKDLSTKKEKIKEKRDCALPHKEIIEYLNSKTGKKFKTTSKKTIALINARIAEDYNIDDFKKVIDNKCASWIDDNKMNAFLRPETLFSSKFEGYLNEISTSDTKSLRTLKNGSKIDWDKL